MSDNDLPPHENPEAGRPDTRPSTHPLFEPDPRLERAAPPPATRIVRRGGTPVLLTLLITAALGGGLWWVWNNPKPGNQAPDQSGLAAQVSALSGQVQEQSGETAKQIAALTARVEKLEQAPPPAAPAPAPGIDQAELGKQFDGLGARIDALAAKEQSDNQTAQQAAQAAQQAAQAVAQQAASDKQQPPPGPSPDLQNQLLTMNQKILEQKVQEDQTINQQKAELIDQIGQGKSELTALQQRVGELEHSQGAVRGEEGHTAREIRIQQAAVALAAGQPLGDVPDAPPELSRFATKAPPTEASLRSAFPQVAEAARAASRPDADKRSFVDRALARMEQSVTVRRGDHVIVGDPAAGVLARAQDDVTNDDLAGAVQALSSLHGPAADAVAGWVAQVKSLLAARAALASLSAHG